MKKRTIIIAEAGVNHNGNIKLAEKLIDAAVTSGADYVKFQTFKADKLVNKFASKADYQISNTEKKNETQYEMLKKLELSIDDHYYLFDYCKLKKIKFLSTAFDLEGLEFLNKLGVDLYKIPSGEITNLPYLKKVTTFNKPIILSTGMASITEIKKALDILRPNNSLKKNITILHCNTAYPTPMKDVNLMAMNHLKMEFKDINIGYSDHTEGIEVAVASAALGATVVEKHFTINKNLIGPDHKSSLEPNELKIMIDSIRNVDLAISGNGKKQVTQSERNNIIHSRKSIHLNKNLNKGENKRIRFNYA